MHLVEVLPLLTREEFLAMGRAGIANVSAITKPTDEALLTTLRDAARVATLRKVLGLVSAPAAA
jgi:hypothetical protein